MTVPPRGIGMKGPVRTYFVLFGVPGDDHGHDVQALGAAAQAVDVGDVGTLGVDRLHELCSNDVMV